MSSEMSNEMRGPFNGRVMISNNLSHMLMKSSVDFALSVLEELSVIYGFDKEEAERHLNLGSVSIVAKAPKAPKVVKSAALVFAKTMVSTHSVKSRARVKVLTAKVVKRKQTRTRRESQITERLRVVSQSARWISRTRTANHQSLTQKS